MGTWILMLSKAFRGDTPKRKLLTASICCVAAAIFFVVGAIGLINGHQMFVLLFVLGAVMLGLKFVPLSIGEHNQSKDS